MKQIRTEPSLKLLMERVRERFEQNMRRHEGIRWAEVRERLDKRPEKVRSLEEMERSGGEPDVVGRDRRTGEILFADCAAESRPGGEAFATTNRRWRPASRTNRWGALAGWRRRWGWS